MITFLLKQRTMHHVSLCINQKGAEIKPFKRLKLSLIILSACHHKRQYMFTITEFFQCFTSLQFFLKLKRKRKTHKNTGCEYELSPRHTAWKTNINFSFLQTNERMHIIKLIYLFKLMNHGEAKQHGQYLLILHTMFPCSTLKRWNLVFNNEVKKHL